MDEKNHPSLSLFSVSVNMPDDVSVMSHAMEVYDILTLYKVAHVFIPRGLI